jgi:histidine triad (HIT) family protein
MEDCIFCRISSGSVPTRKVYEDDLTFAFLDNHPINPGHILVVPKTHEPDFHKLNDIYYSAVMQTVKNLSGLVDAKLKPKKVGILVAGWDVPHVHVHIVPMHDYHDLTSKPLLDGTRANPTEKEFEEVLSRLVN